jgi:hypothetical protein
MAFNLKYYRDPFVLEKSKLDRLTVLLREAIGPSPGLEEHYEIHHADGTLTFLETTDKVFQLDNSGKKLITSLKVRVASMSVDAPQSLREVDVTFEENLNGAKTSISVLDPDPRWVASTFALLEEQVERCLKKDILHRLAASQPPAQIALLICSAILMVITILLVDKRFELRNHMWLSPTDMAEIETQLSDPAPLTQDQYLAIVKRQLKNLRHPFSTRPFEFSWSRFFVFAPILIMSASLLYLILFCYPSAIFLWGDREGWHSNLLKRRAFVWNAILASTAISILSGLFVLGIQSSLYVVSEIL